MNQAIPSGPRAGSFSSGILALLAALLFAEPAAYSCTYPYANQNRQDGLYQLGLTEFLVVFVL